MTNKEAKREALNIAWTLVSAHDGHWERGNTKDAEKIDKELKIISTSLFRKYNNQRSDK